MDRDWHRAHPMPAGANLQQRIEWHIAHAAACGCREIPESVKQALQGRGDAVPDRKTD